MELDSRFKYDDLEHVPFETDKYTDEELLIWLNYLPRRIGLNFAELEAIESEVESRELFEPVQIELEERTDDWLAEARNNIKLELAKLKKRDEELREFRSSIDEELMRRFKDRGTSGTRTSRFTISLREDDSYPEIEDRTVFEDYVINTKKIHLLQKRLSLSAIQEELASMQEEYNSYKERLDKAKNKNALAKDIYYEVFGSEDNELLDNKVSILEQTNQLLSTLKSDLKDHFSVPGVKVVTKKVINSVKRG